MVTSPRQEHTGHRGQPSVRPAGPDDASAIAELHRYLHEPHVDAMPHEYRPYDAAATRTYYAEVLGGATRPAWVAEIGGRPVGFIGCEVRERPASPFTTALRVLYVHQIAVAPSARRQGVGRALMRTAEDAAPRRGCDEVRLDHRAFNEQAHRFYESLGYRTHLVGMAKSVGE